MHNEAHIIPGTLDVLTLSLLNLSRYVIITFPFSRLKF